MFSGIWRDIFHFTHNNQLALLHFGIYFGLFTLCRSFIVFLLILFGLSLGNFPFRILVLQKSCPFSETLVFIGFGLVDSKGKLKKVFINRVFFNRMVININLLVFGFAIPRFRSQLSLSKESTVHELN